MPTVYILKNYFIHYQCITAKYFENVHRFCQNGHKLLQINQKSQNIM
jgi:hypothetical protein